MTKEKELKDQRIPIMMSESEVQALDDWSFNHRIRSRGEAIRRLCQIGLTFDARASEFGDIAKRAGSTFSRHLHRSPPSDEHDLAKISTRDILDILQHAEEVDRCLLGPLLEISKTLDSLRSERSPEAINAAIRLLKAYREKVSEEKAEKDEQIRSMFGDFEGKTRKEDE